MRRAVPEGQGLDRPPRFLRHRVTARAGHKVAFDRMISAAETKAFKPHVATYVRTAEIMGVRSMTEPAALPAP